MTNRLLVSVASAVLLALFSHPTFAQETSRTSWGPPLDLGNGVVRTYVMRNADGAPVEIGVAFSDGALEDLPAPVDDDMIASIHTWPLAFPTDTPAPYRFVGFDYNALGHPPVGIYDVPHFDFHFNFVSQAARDSIVPSDPDWDAKAKRVPEADMMPSGYDLLPLPPIPQMGVHWRDPASPEFHDQPFTETLLYGTWDGRLIFVEPMITLDFLRGVQDTTTSFPVPEKVSRPGWYPTKYRVYRDPDSGQVRVALTGLVHRGE